MIVDQARRDLVHGWTKLGRKKAGLGPVFLSLDQWFNPLWTMDQYFSLNEIWGEIRKYRRHFSLFLPYIEPGSRTWSLVQARGKLDPGGFAVDKAAYRGGIQPGCPSLRTSASAISAPSSP
jgi:hypothetical protein